MKNPNMPSSPKPLSQTRRRLLRTAAAITVAGIGMPAYGYEVEADHLEVVRRDVTVPGWPKSASGLKIGQLSDLHCQDERAVARAARAANMLLAEEPDVVFVTGDYITSGPPGDWSGAAADALAPLRNVPRGVFAVLGNHDFANGRVLELVAALSENGFHVLRNHSLPLPGTEGIWIVGLEPRSYQGQKPVEAMQNVPKDATKLLLIHEPDYADEAPPGFALQLSGHSHAGQIRIPGLPPLYCPSYGRHYPEGLQQAPRHQVYTTRGVGMMGPQMRFCCPPEVTVLTLHSK